MIQINILWFYIQMLWNLYKKYIKLIIGLLMKIINNEECSKKIYNLS